MSAAREPSLLLAEIREQPEALSRLLSRESAHAASVAAELARAQPAFLMVAARGTSDNAARYAQYLFGARNRLVVALAAPSLFGAYRDRFAPPPRLAAGAVLGISQSGQSPDIVRVVEEGTRQGAVTIAITNEPASPLAKAARHVIPLHAGEERSVAATKTYTSSLAALAMLSVALDGDEADREALAALPRAVTGALATEKEARSAAERLALADRCVLLGRGFHYATVCEIALKVKELARVEAEPFSSADFLHGPIALIEPGFPVLVVSAGVAVREELDALTEALRAKGANLVVLSDHETSRRPNEPWLPIQTGLPEWLSPMLAVVPGQLLTYHLARARGCDPDRPRALQKVTRTE